MCSENPWFQRAYNSLQNIRRFRSHLVAFRFLNAARCLLTGNRDPRRSNAPTPLASTQIVPRYAQVMDQNRLDAMKKLEELKKSASTSQEAAESVADEAADGMRQ